MVIVIIIIIITIIIVIATSVSLIVMILNNTMINNIIGCILLCTSVSGEIMYWIALKLPKLNFLYIIYWWYRDLGWLVDPIP